MQAEERKDLETNSLAQSLSSMKGKFDSRTLYFVIGTIVLIIAGVLLYRHFAKTRTIARDAKILQLETADTPEKLKTLMEEQRGNIFGSIAKLHIARRALTTDGLERLGTDNSEDRRKAAASLDQARIYFADLTKEFKQSDEPALLQESWLGLAQAEEALVGLPTTEGGSDSRGDADKAIEAYTKAAAIFPDLELSKKYAAHAKDLKDNKATFVDAQTAFYAIPPAPKVEGPKVEVPSVTPKVEPPKPDGKFETPKIEFPIVDPKKEDAKKDPAPKKPDAPKLDPEPKKPEAPKVDSKPVDPKSK